jgi:hypothetical protein
MLGNSGEDVQREWGGVGIGIVGRANKLRGRIAGAPGLAVRSPGRPKGMWRRTYDRLRDAIREAEDAAEKAFITRGW